MLREIARLPVVVVGGVVHLVVEERIGALQIVLVQVRSRTGLQIKLVTVGSAEVEGDGAFGSVGFSCGLK